MATVNYNKGYRINGFEQIKGFYSWVFNNPDKARPTHISLYLFLINQANRANWVEWFKCPYDLAMQGACIGNNGTYYRCLDDLQKWNLIEYTKGINNYKAPLINLIRLYSNEQVTVPLSEQVTEQVTEQLIGQLPEHIYKLLIDNLKPITDNIEEVVEYLSIKGESKKELNVPFEAFWDKYDKKVGDKRACVKKWIKLKDNERVIIIETLPAFIKSIKDKQYQPYPERYLSEERWNNEIKNIEPEYELVPNPETGNMVKKIKQNDSKRD